MEPTLSIIIPVLNEEETLPTLLQDIKTSSASLPFQTECIVVDGGSKDRSVAVCQQLSVPVIESAKGRGQQLAAGAHAARGEILLFLHADSRLTADHCSAAVDTVRQNGIMAGSFKLRFDDGNPILKMAEYLNLIRFACTKIAYGDHGLFMRRENYDAVGGFRAQPLFEDIELCRALRKKGKIVMIAPAMLTSARRFRAGGVIRTYLRMAVLHILYWLKISPDTLAKIYQKP